MKSSSVTISNILYTLCTVALAVISWTQVCLDGRIQFATANLTGVIVALVILSAYKPKDFKNIGLVIWSAVVLIGAPIAIYWGIHNYSYPGKWITGVLNCCVYGYIVILVFTRQLNRDTRAKRIWPLFGAWVLMILLMVISPNKAVWPLWFGVMFGCLYLTDFNPELEKKLVNALLNGILISFAMIQTYAFLFRPYDVPRYKGAFLGCNYNALFYLTVYTSFLCKLLIRRRQQAKRFEQILLFCCAGAMFGLAVITGCRTVLVAMPVVTCIVLAGFLMGEKKKIKFAVSFLLGSILIFVLSVPLAYASARYLPTILNRPRFYKYEWTERSVMRGDPWDSWKYVSFEEMLRVDVGRILWFLPEEEETSEQTVEEESAYPDAGEAKILYEGRPLSSVEERIVIWKYYIGELRIYGHISEDGSVRPTYHGWHAHNYLLQMSYWFGIPVGLLLLGFFVACFVKYVSLLKRKQYVHACVLGGFVAVFMLYGLLESSWGIGDFNHTLFYILLYIVFKKNKKEKTLTAGEQLND